MELVYASLLLHDLKQPINEGNLKKVVSAAGGKAEDAQIKALVAALDGVNIDEAIKQSMAMAPAASAAPAPAEQKKEEKDEKKEEKAAEEAAAGLSSLFG